MSLDKELDNFFETDSNRPQTKQGVEATATTVMFADQNTRIFREELQRIKTSQ
jgi:hypothetical protein